MRPRPLARQLQTRRRPGPQPTGKQTLLNKLYGELREVPMDGDGNVVGNPLVTIRLYACSPRAPRGRGRDEPSCSATG